jgi:gliding motility-associated-like protein
MQIIAHIIKLSLLVIGLFPLMLAGQIASEIECLVVNNDGSVTISWEQYIDVAADFTGYQINKKLPADAVFTSTGPVIADISSISITDNAPGIDANIQQYCYQIWVIRSGPVILESNSLCTINLSGTSDITLGLVDLMWVDPLPTGSFLPAGTIYEVYYEFPAGNWILDGFFDYETGLNSYDHVVKVCDDLVNFRVDLKKPASSCLSSSNIITLQVEDHSDPGIPIVTTVTVDSLTGFAQLEWFQSSATDLAGYIIYQCIGGSQIQLQTISDPSSTSFLDINSSPGTSPENYLVSSFDNCPTPNLSPTVLPGATTICPNDQSSIYLDYQWVVCQDFVDLAWTTPPWGEDGLAYMEVYRRTNGGVDELLESIVAAEYEFRDESILPNETYSYFIKAYSSDPNTQGATALSNIQTLEVSAPPIPTGFSLVSASITSATEIEIKLSTSPTTTPFEYALLRKAENESFYRDVDFNIAQTLTEFTFYDTDVEPQIYTYEYVIALINECSDTSAISNIGKTILLSGLDNPGNLVNTISWSAYEGWTTGVDSYDIYRTIDGGIPQFLASNQANIRFYEDDVEEFLKTKGEFCYQIKASENANPISNAISLSNEICLTQPPKIWIPNAFSINGINDEFKPVISFADFTTYRMIIYSRWGQQIFESRDIDLGWDGTKNGNLIQEGNYMYYIEIQDGSGKLYEERGSLTMLIFNAN